MTVVCFSEQLALASEYGYELQSAGRRKTVSRSIILNNISAIFSCGIIVVDVSPPHPFVVPRNKHRVSISLHLSGANIALHNNTQQERQHPLPGSVLVVCHRPRTDQTRTIIASDATQMAKRN